MHFMLQLPLLVAFSHLLIQHFSLLLNLPSHALPLSCVHLIRKEVGVCSNAHSFVSLPTFHAFPFSVFLTSRSQSCKGQRLSHLKSSACPSSRALQFVYQPQFILAHCLEITDKHLTALLNSLAHVCWSTCVSVAVAIVLSFTFNIFKCIFWGRKVKNSVFSAIFSDFNKIFQHFLL